MQYYRRVDKNTRWIYYGDNDQFEEDNYGGGFGFSFRHLEKMYFWVKLMRELHNAQKSTTPNKARHNNHKG